MTIFTFIIVIIVVGVLLWLINAFIPMDAKIKQILNVVVVILLIVWILKVLGVFSYMTNVKV